jgi:TnpA family transposase
MPAAILTAADQERLNSFPTNMSPTEVVDFFTLGPKDVSFVNKSEERHRLGYALQLTTLRYLGFIPPEILKAPQDVIEHLCEQLDVTPGSLARYTKRTRQRHAAGAARHLGYREATPADVKTAAAQLLERALDHDKPMFLLRALCEHFFTEKILRPGLSKLEKVVAESRVAAQRELFERVEPALTPARKRLLNSLLIPSEEHGMTPLRWLSREETSASPAWILHALKRLHFLREAGVHRWKLAALSPNRIKLLGRLARRYTNQALQRMPDVRRYPILLGFLYQAHHQITDEVVDLFAEALARVERKSKGKLADYRGTVARATNEKLKLFQDIVAVLLDGDVADPSVRSFIFRRVAPKQKLASALDDARKIARPVDDNYYDFMAHHYSQLRRFAPTMLAAFTLKGGGAAKDLLDALRLLEQLDTKGQRQVPENPPLNFVPRKWLRQVVTDKGVVDRRAYELCALYELRSNLRSGNIWLAGSRRYADMDIYLLPKGAWRRRRSAFCKDTGVAANGAKHLEALQNDLEGLLTKVDDELPINDQVRITERGLVISNLDAEIETESASMLQEAITQRLPRIDLTDLLIEVDGWTNFTRHLEHASGSQPRSKDLLRHQHAALLAQSWNLGLSEVARTAELSYDRLRWVTRWYLRDETLKPAFTELVNFHHALPLAKMWGGGTFSSSDGQRFPVAAKARNARVIPRYGPNRIITFYSWTSDQHSQYGTKPIVSTDRDGRYVLDEILDNESELELFEHTTDTAGYTEIVFALFDLLGMRFSPRLRDMADRQLFRMDRKARHINLRPMLKGIINQKLILEHWDELLRIAASIKDGQVTASLLIGKLQSYPQKNAVARALQEYGRISKTMSILRALNSEEHRRRINRQLNKGEGVHSLRRFLAYGNLGEIRKSQPEEHSDQASCLNLVTNAVIIWNTIYMQEVIHQLRKEGLAIGDEELKHLSPVRFDHINRLGRYSFNVEAGQRRKRLRPLRRPPR